MEEQINRLKTLKRACMDAPALSCFARMMPLQRESLHRE